MATYYVANIPFNGTDAISHHGVKGQKWGVRRYQNPDGTLTEEGKKRYGENFGTGNSHSILRRIATGDTFLGQQRWRDKRESRLKAKAEKLKSQGKDASKVESKYEAQKKKNIDIANYVSNTSTAKLWLQNYFMTPYTADRYRAARARGNDRVDSFIESILPGFNMHPLNTESVLAKERDKAKYGDIAHGLVND